MNCFEARRLLIAAPRDRDAAQERHIAACRACTKLVSDLQALDRRIESATLIPAPDALTHRVLLEHPRYSSWRYAAAAALCMISVALGLFGATFVHIPGWTYTAVAVGPEHPAVTAIAQVANEALEGPRAAGSNGTAQIDQGLKRLGLTLRKGEATASYVGRCHVAGSRECEQIVLSTRDAQANVMLLPDYPLPDRLLVADRRMIALVHPAAQGGYIVVADSAEIAKRMEKFFKKG